MTDDYEKDNITLPGAVAMGTGADVAMESAGITLLGGDLITSPAPPCATSSRTCSSPSPTIPGVPVAAVLLYPHTGMLLSPMIAAAAISLSSVSVISNALRLRRIEL